MKKVKLAVALIWHSIISFLSPICIGWIYMDITGNGKGYGYNLGAEKDIWIVSGIFELFLYIALLVPVMIWLTNYFKAINKWLIVIPYVIFAILFSACVALLGFEEFLSFFNIVL